MAPQHHGISTDGEVASTAGDDGLRVVARAAFDMAGDVQGLVTFLNRALKSDGYIVGLRLAKDGAYEWTVYRA